jgi:hypothetical protein
VAGLCRPISKAAHIWLRHLLQYTERFECWLEKFGIAEGLNAILAQVFPATDLGSDIGSGSSAKRVDLNAAPGSFEYTSASGFPKSGT